MCVLAKLRSSEQHRLRQYRRHDRVAAYPTWQRPGSSIVYGSNIHCIAPYERVFVVAYCQSPKRQRSTAHVSTGYCKTVRATSALAMAYQARSRIGHVVPPEEDGSGVVGVKTSLVESGL